jgi:hypothetical protein
MQSAFVVRKGKINKKMEEKVMGISNLGKKRSPYKVLGKASKN